MATILIVDDRPVNRQYLVTLLGYSGHRTLEASDGAEALALASTERPDLVVTDILMPTMDGAELVRAMRSSPELAAVPVIFYSASYREKEARAVADGCGVSIVLSKPADPEDVLRAVDEALGCRAASAADAEPRAEMKPPGVDLGLVTDALRKQLTEEQRSASRLAVIIELGLDLTGERDASRLCRQVCRGARDIVSGRFASVGLLGEDGRTLAQFHRVGLPTEDTVWPPVVLPLGGELGKLVGDGKPRRLSGALTWSDLGLPDAHRAVSSFLGVAVTTARRVYGWLCFCNKVGATEFNVEDERLAITLAAQLAVAYENVLLGDEAAGDAEILRVQAGALAAAANAIMITDRQGTIVWVNPALERLSGHPVEELLGKNPRLFSSGRQNAAFYRQLWETIVAGKVWSAELVNQRKDGSLYTEEMTITPVRDARSDITHFVAVKQDISERKRADAALRESEERFREMAENVNEVFWMSDPRTTRILYVSPAYEKIWGRTCQSLYEQPLSFLEGVHPEDRAGMLAALETRAAHGSFQQEFRVVRPDGSVRWIWDRSFPVRNVAGELVRVVGIAQDISERKGLEEQLRQAQKMEAIGQLAGGVAHDFNNLLTVIKGRSHLLLQDFDSSSPVGSKIELIHATADRAAILTRQLLAFSRKQILEPTVLDLTAVVTGLTPMLQRLIGEDVEFTIVPGTGAGRVRADRGQIEQVLMNLVVNARDAMPHGGRLTIQTARVEIDQAFTAYHPEVPPGAYAIIAVSDTGSGMSPEVQARIFEPFFTTKEVGKGSGLGLSTVYGIVRQHGGCITVESELGRGSTFRVYLSRVAVTTEASVSAATPTEAPRGVETLLLVEDETEVRALARDVLETLGYKVLEAPDGHAALEIAEQEAGHIDLLITDVVMPGLNGVQVAERLKASHLETRVLYTSGYADDKITSHGVLTSGTMLLCKPFTPDELASKVREVLDARLTNLTQV
jgi:PAS domain S-box-containing protein